MSVRSFQQIVDEAERLKPYKARYIGPDAHTLGFTSGKVYEVTDDESNRMFSPDCHFVNLKDDDGYDRHRHVDEFEKVE